MKRSLRYTSTALISLVFAGIGFLVGSTAQEKQPAITRPMIAEAERIIGLRFSKSQRDSLLDEANANLAAYAEVRTMTLPNSIPPAFVFNPIPTGFVLPTKGSFQTSSVRSGLPDNREDLAFYKDQVLDEDATVVKKTCGSRCSAGCKSRIGRICDG